MTTNKVTIDHPAPRPTRYPDLGYRQDGPGLWRIYAPMHDNPGAVGPHYRTKAELLADLDRYAADYGCAAGCAKPEPRPRVRLYLLADHADSEPQPIGGPQSYPDSLTELSALLTAGAALAWPGEPFQVRGRPGELCPLVAVRPRDGATLYVDAATDRNRRPPEPAALLAAGPDLLDACKTFIRLWPIRPGGTEPKGTPDVLHCWRKACAAVRKATAGV